MANKLRKTQIVEVCLRLLMRILLGIRIEEDCENEKRISNHDCGSENGHSVGSELLEKRLTLDLAERTGEQVAYTISDLEACCDVQLPSIEDIVEASIGENRGVIKLVTKVLARRKNF